MTIEPYCCGYSYMKRISESKMKILFLAPLYFFIIGCSQDDQNPLPPQVNDPIVIEDPVEDEIEDESEFMEDTLNFTYLALGDSYTIGQNVAVEERWPLQLRDVLRGNDVALDTVEIIAQTGWTTANLISAVEKKNFTSSFDIVSLLIGVNNQYQGKSITEYSREFELLLNMAIGLAGGKPDKVFVLSIPDYSVTPFAAHIDTAKIKRELIDFNAVNKKIALEYEVAYFDITPLSQKAKDDATLLADDGLHPSGKMYREWVDLIFNDIIKIINQ